MARKKNTPESTFTQIQKLSLWGKTGAGYKYDFKIDTDITEYLQFNLDEAQRIKNQKKNEQSPNRLLEGLSKRGLRFVGRIIQIDEADLVGLIGEILSEKYSESKGHEILYPKWKISGSSKSRGIDLVVRTLENDEWVLILCESKHIHKSVKTIRPELSANRIRARFREGLNEFEYEKTLLTLARIMMSTGSDIRRIEAMGGNTDQVTDFNSFLSECLADELYDINVIIFVDIKRCDKNTFQESINKIEEPIHVGKNRRVSLFVIESENLEKTTNEAREIYVG